MRYVFVLLLLTGCTTTPVGVEFSREQCRLLQERGDEHKQAVPQIRPGNDSEEPTANAPDAPEPPPEPGKAGGLRILVLRRPTSRIHLILLILRFRLWTLQTRLIHLIRPTRPTRRTHPAAPTPDQTSRGRRTGR